MRDLDVLTGIKNIYGSKFPWFGYDDHRFLAWLETNGLGGFFYSRFKECFSSQSMKRLKDAYQRQAILNTVLLEELNQIYGMSQKIGITPVTLKGGALIRQLYRDLGERCLTDIDLLVHSNDFNLFESSLKKFGYRYVPQIVWSGNAHKRTYVRKNEWGNSLYVDLHTALFWRQRSGFQPRYEQSSGLMILDPVSQFVHLIANWSYQDNFVSLSKLIDLSLFLSTNPDIPTHREFKEIVSQNDLSLAWWYTQQALNCLGHKMGGMGARPRTSRIFNEAFLASPQASRLKYIILKHRTKSLHRAFIYDLLWVKAYGISTASKFIYRGQS